MLSELRQKLRLLELWLIEFVLCRCFDTHVYTKMEAVHGKAGSYLIEYCTNCDEIVNCFKLGERNDG